MESYKLGKTKIQIPSGWHEINYNKALLIIDGELNEVQTLALLTDKSEKDIRTATDINTIFYFINTFQYIHKLPEQVNEFPRSVKLGIDRLIFPYVSYGDKFDLGQSDVGQVEDMLMIMVKMSNEFIGEEERKELTQLELILITPFIVSIYLQKVLDGEYDGKKAMKLVERVKEELSFKECLSIGYFFLNRLNSYRSGQPNGLRVYHSIRKKFRRGLMNLMQRMGSTLH